MCAQPAGARKRNASSGVVRDTGRLGEAPRDRVGQSGSSGLTAAALVEQSDRSGRAACRAFSVSVGTGVRGSWGIAAKPSPQGEASHDLASTLSPAALRRAL